MDKKSLTQNYTGTGDYAISIGVPSGSYSPAPDSGFQADNKLHPCERCSNHPNNGGSGVCH